LISRPEFDNASNGIFAATSRDRSTLGETEFHSMITMERRRSARTRKSLALMLLDMGEHMPEKEKRAGMGKVLSTMSRALRETDIVGWYREGSVVGVMFTEIALDDQNALPAMLMTRVGNMLKQQLHPKEFHELTMSFHLSANMRGPALVSHRTHPAVYGGMSNAGNETSF
jgi:hypothetical protein